MPEESSQPHASGGDTHSLLAGFQQRMVDGLALDNVLRGSWAEEVVAHFLEDCKFSEQWSFYDFMWEGQRVSVKHSTGPAARFSVQRKRFGWAPSEGIPFGGPVGLAGVEQRSCYRERDLHQRRHPTLISEAPVYGLA